MTIMMKMMTIEITMTMMIHKTIFAYLDPPLFAAAAIPEQIADLFIYLLLLLLLFGLLYTVPLLRDQKNKLE